MSEPTTSSENSIFRLETFPFVKIFSGFRTAVQPGKLMLALMGVVLIFVAGWLLDTFSVSSARVIQGPKSLSDNAIYTELDV